MLPIHTPHSQTVWFARPKLSQALGISHFDNGPRIFGEKNTRNTYCIPKPTEIFESCPFKLSIAHLLFLLSTTGSGRKMLL